MSAPAQPRDGLGRYASRECPSTYRRLVAAQTAPVPPLVERVAGGILVVSHEAGSSWHGVPAPRCPHGHFARWAARHCRPCGRQR